MKTSSFVSGIFIGAVTGMAADMLLRPKAYPQTNAGKAMQTVTNAVDGAAKSVKNSMK